MFRCSRLTPEVSTISSTPETGSRWSPANRRGASIAPSTPASGFCQQAVRDLSTPLQVMHGEGAQSLGLRLPALPQARRRVRRYLVAMQLPGRTASRIDSHMSFRQVGWPAPFDMRRVTLGWMKFDSDSLAGTGDSAVTFRSSRRVRKVRGGLCGKPQGAWLKSAKPGHWRRRLARSSQVRDSRAVNPVECRSRLP